MKYCIVIYLLISFPVIAKDLSKIVKIKNLFIETEKRTNVNREYYLVNQKSAEYDFNLGLNLDLPMSFYYNNIVNSITDNSQFRFIGYQFEVGAKPFNGVDIYFQHFSGHALDQRFTEDFPQRNKFGVRFNFINR